MKILVSLMAGSKGAVLGIGGEYPQLEGNPSYLMTSSGDPRVLSYTLGLYMDLDTGQIHAMGSAPSPSHTWSWEHKEWLYDSALQSANTSRLLVDSLAAIDTAAGNTRLKYITSVPGQSETYQRKEEQARAWQSASFAGDAPSFIAAEATALAIDAQVLTLQIIALADYWGNVKGPQIEAARRKAKVAIESAGTDDAAIIAARDAGITELASL